MMTAHIVYPTLDPDNPGHDVAPHPHRPAARRVEVQAASSSPTAMDMHAIAGRYGVGNAAVRALTAGADMVMALGTTETQNETLDSIAAAIASGELTMDEVKVRLDRLAALAKALPIANPRSYKEDAADREVMAEGWRRSLTAYGTPRRPGQGCPRAPGGAPGRRQRRRLRSRRAGRGSGRVAEPPVRRRAGDLRRRRHLRLEHPAEGRPLHHPRLDLAPALRPARARHLAPPTCTWHYGTRTRRSTSRRHR